MPDFYTTFVYSICEFDTITNLSHRSQPYMRIYNYIFLQVILILFVLSSFVVSQVQDSSDVSLDSLLNVQINQQQSPLLKQINSATKYRQMIGEAPASVSIITSDEIERYGYQTLAEVLSRVRGFYISDDRNYMYVGVRGFGRPTDYNNRILLLINDHPVNENVYGSMAIGNDLGIDLSSIEHIEIVRGPSSALYGTNAMFAVINIVTKTGNILDGTQIKAELGSYDSRSLSVMYGNEFDDGIDVFISGKMYDSKGQDLYYQEYNTDSTNFGIAEQLDWEQFFNVTTKISYKNFRAMGMLTERKKGIPTGAWGIKFNQPDAETFDGFGFLDLRYDHDFSSDKVLSISSSINNYRYRGTSPYDVYQYDLSEGAWYGGELQFRWDTRSNNRILMGLEYRNSYEADYELWSPDTIYFANDYPFNQYSLYFQNEYKFPFHLSLTLGLRWDKYSSLEGSTTPKLGVIYSPTQSNIFKLLYGEAFRVPNIYETNFEDPISGYKKFTPLQSERIKSLEVVWEHQFNDEVSSTLSIYNLKMENLIDQLVDPTDAQIYYSNYGEINASGIEFKLLGNFQNDIHTYVNYSVQLAEDSHTKLKLTNSPNQLLKFGVSVPVIDYIFASLDGYYESERFTIYQTFTESYFKSNLTLAYLSLSKDATPFSELLDHFDITFKVNNLFNTSTHRTEHREDLSICNR